MKRYFIGHDNSGHTYVVPVERGAEWYSWANLDDDDERAWDEPEFAKRIPGSLSLLTFCEPVIDVEEFEP